MWRQNPLHMRVHTHTHTRAPGLRVSPLAGGQPLGVDAALSPLLGSGGQGHRVLSVSGPRHGWSGQLLAWAGPSGRGCGHQVRDTPSTALSTSDPGSLRRPIGGDSCARGGGQVPWEPCASHSWGMAQGQAWVEGQWVWDGWTLPTETPDLPGARPSWTQWSRGLARVQGGAAVGEGSGGAGPSLRGQRGLGSAGGRPLLSCEGPGDPGTRFL